MLRKTSKNDKIRNNISTQIVFLNNTCIIYFVTFYNNTQNLKIH